MLSCPACDFDFSLDEVSKGMSRCPSCDKRLEVVAFPALYRMEEKVCRLSAQEDDARCAFHSDNQAASVCSQCGRLICSVCALPLGKRTVCPQCINRALHAEKVSPAAKRIAWDTLALELVAHPLLIFVWWGSFFTALASLCISITCFNKPAGPLPRGKWRFVLSILLSVVWIGAWIIGIYFFADKVWPTILHNMKKG